MIPLRDAQLQNYETTKREFANHSGVINTTVGFGIPGDLIAGDEIIDPEKNKTVPVNLFCIDHDYIQTMGMTIISGREFSKEIPTDTSEAFIINETAVKRDGIQISRRCYRKAHPLEYVGKEFIKTWSGDRCCEGF